MRWLAIGSGLLLAMASTADAEDVSAPIALSGTTSIVSDYRYRGVSFSRDRPALQSDLSATAASGMYVDLFASTIAYGSARQEVDLTVGRRFTLGPLTIDASSVRYSFPGGRDLNYWELPLTASRTDGAWTWTGGIAYVPPQRSTSNQSNTYESVGATWQPPSQPYALSGSLGLENGAFARRKLDWSLSFGRRISKANISLAIVGYREGRCENALVASVGFDLKSLLRR